MARRRTGARHHDRDCRRRACVELVWAHRSHRRWTYRAAGHRRRGAFAGPGWCVMRAILSREALVTARTPILIAAAIVSAGLLALFPVAWGVRGIPTLDGASL